MSSTARLLDGVTVGLSAGDATDAAHRGVTPVTLDYFVRELTFQLLAVGANLAYGGDMRRAGFTETIAEAAFRYEKRDSDGGMKRRLHHFVPWPVPTAADEGSLLTTYVGVIARTALDETGRPRRREPSGEDATPRAWEEGLGAMRRLLAEQIGACVAVGGKIEDYKGIMPGIVQEVDLASERSLPVYVAGGFGGAARQIVEERMTPGTLPAWAERSHLDVEEVSRLAETVDPDEAVTLVLMGLVRHAESRD